MKKNSVIYGFVPMVTAAGYQFGPVFGYLFMRTADSSGFYAKDGMDTVRTIII